MKTRLVKRGAIAVTLAALFALGASRGQEVSRTAIATTPHFAFYSDYATNLNDALLAAGLARNAGEPELFHAGAQASCFDGLAPSARAGWDRAVDYYAEIISPTGWDDRQQDLLRRHLAREATQSGDAQARRFIAIASGFWAAATPAYDDCRWPQQDAANRRWIESIKEVLATHEKTLAPRLEALYQTPWHGLPIVVDIVQTVSWSGANTVFRQPAGGHLLISVEYQGPAALEIVFHEASHLLVGRSSPLRQALAGAASSLGVPLPRDLWHPVMFHATGNAVRRALEDSGQRGYTPMIYEIYGRSRWGRYQEAIESTWPAYLNGERTLSAAATELLQAIGRQQNSE